jgi:hypothetical protein
MAADGSSHYFIEASRWIIVRLLLVGRLLSGNARTASADSALLDAAVELRLD